MKVVFPIRPGRPCRRRRRRYRRRRRRRHRRHYISADSVPWEKCPPDLGISNSIEAEKMGGADRKAERKAVGEKGGKVAKKKK